MQLNGVKTFKVDTVSDTGTPGLTPEEEAAEQQGQIEDFFAGPTETTESTPPPNSVGANDYTFGDIQGDVVATSQSSSDVATWLSDFPPTVDEILIGNENAINYLDIVLARYEQAKQDLLRLDQAYQLELNSGEATDTRIQELIQLRQLITVALSRCDGEIQRTNTKAVEADNQYLEEMRTMKDLNGDSWIARPYANGSYYVKYDQDGNAIYYDPKTKQAIANPLMDPTYEPELTKNGNLTKIEKDADYPPEGMGPAANLYLKLKDENALTTTSGPYDTVIDLGIPEYMWVERNGDGNGPDPYKMEWNEDGTGGMALYNEWDSANGIKQKVPADLSRYMQVQVTGMRITSEYSGVSDDLGNKLYDTVVELYNGDIASGTLICRIRIEGTAVNGDVGPAAQLADGGYYVGASSVGLSLNGDRRVSPIQVDASGYRSTGRHIVDPTQLGISAPQNAEGTNAQEAYDNNLDAFRSVGDYSDYNNSTDEYISEDTAAPVDDDNFSTSERLGIQTGIFISGIRGDIKGTAYNDIIWTTGVNEYTTLYQQEHRPKNNKPITKDDPFYANRVDAGNGDNIVITGAGDNYVFGATFFWGENAGQGENFIALQHINLGDEATSLAHGSRNPQCFVHSTGGSKTYLYNPSEYNPEVTEDINDPGNDNEGYNNALEDADSEYRNDDYFYISNSFVAHNPNDTDFDPSCHSLSNTTCGDLPFWTDAANVGMEGWLDALMKIPDVDEADAPINWDEIDGQETLNDDEMNSFFDTMFGEMDGFMTESTGEMGGGLGAG